MLLASLFLENIILDDFNSVSCYSLLQAFRWMAIAKSISKKNMQKPVYLNKQLFVTNAHSVIAGRRTTLSSLFIKTQFRKFHTYPMKLFPMTSFPIKRENGPAVATGITWQFYCTLESASIALAIFCTSLL